MTPAARAQAAIELIDAWRNGGEGLDRMLTRWGRAHRFAGSGDRHAIADLVYDAVRRLRSSAWVAGVAEPATGRDILRGSLMRDGVDPAPLFSGQRFAPARLAGAETRPPRSLAEAPRPVRLDYPDWLAPELDNVPDEVLAAMTGRAPLYLRVNLLRIGRTGAVAALARDGIETEASPLSPTALKVLTKPRAVHRSCAYRDGLVEIQDAASQAVADLAAARPGDTVLDLCAGGGGKTLALAAAMGNAGRLCAYDAARQRLADLPGRAARAGARVEILEESELAGLGPACDLVLVDAPCSGSGVWRRNPDAKWRLTRRQLNLLRTTQADLLDRAASFVRPGGRLVYATCSLLCAENEEQTERFLAETRDWCLEAVHRFSPLDGGDGFFVADLRAPASRED